MAKARGRRGGGVRRYLQQQFAQIIEDVLPGATRVGAKVIAEEAQNLLGDRRAEAAGGVEVLIADSVKVRTRKRGGVVVARIMLQGPGAYVGRWLEYGTSPHFISVDDERRQGMTARRINKRIKEGDSALKSTLIINGKPVGATVFHPGATAHPFLRPALDTKIVEATSAAQSYIDRRVRRSGIIERDEGDDA